jgi:inner membrane protein involved in colicin E2 resistance
MNAEPPVIPTPASRRLAVFLKVTCICLLIPFLLIPLSMTNGVLRERQGYQNQATQEIAGLWGKAQQVSGPVLVVPYAYKTMLVRQKIVGEKVVPVEEPGLQWTAAYFLPDKLVVQGAVEPEVRHRGIYDAVVYSTRLKFAGGFQPDFAAAGIESEKRAVTVQRNDAHAPQPLEHGVVDDDQRSPVGDRHQLDIGLRAALGGATRRRLLEERDDGPADVRVDLAQAANDFVR